MKNSDDIERKAMKTKVLFNKN